MNRQISQLFNSDVPIGRNPFALGLIVAAILDRVVCRSLRDGGAEMHVIFAIWRSVVLYFLLAVLTAKRLSDIGWSRKWSLLAVGPALFDILVGIGNADSPYVKVAVYPLFALLSVYVLLAIVLVEMRGGKEPGRSQEKREGLTLGQSLSTVFPARIAL